MGRILGHFDSVVYLDFEFQCQPGEVPRPLCLVAKEVSREGTREVKLFGEELRNARAPPFGVEHDTLVIAYYAPAEWSCFLELGWPLPAQVVDLYAEFRALTSGKVCPHGHGLLGALAYFGLPAMAGIEKSSVRERIQQGPPFSEDERIRILDYCAGDVTALEKLFQAMEPGFQDHKCLGQAIWRGRFTQAIAVMERHGVPIDTEFFAWLQSNGQALRDSIVSGPDAHGLWEEGKFHHRRFESLLSSLRLGDIWPRTATGIACIDGETLKNMSDTHSVIEELRQVFRLSGTLPDLKLSVGKDGRNRCLLSPFGSKTGRCQPSSNKFVFGLGKTLRPLIKPAADQALAILDYEQQEFGIGAALSGDKAMQHDYATGDPYLAFAVRAGAAPPNATAETHGAVRELYKRCILATQYGAGAKSLGMWLGIGTPEAELLLLHHKRLYRRFWEWQDSIIAAAQFNGRLQTVFGWPLHVQQSFNARSVSNFLLQGNGAEILRLACIFGVEAGIGICAPVHDAVLIEAPLEEIDHATGRMRNIMVAAGREVLGGFELRVDCRVIRYPDRYPGSEGNQIWAWLYGKFRESAYE